MKYITFVVAVSDDFDGEDEILDSFTNYIANDPVFDIQTWTHKKGDLANLLENDESDDESD